jgi:hypothetical protein
MNIRKLKEKLEREEDPRQPWGNIRRKLENIPVIGLATLIRNGEDFQETEAFGAHREAELKKFLKLPHGIPDESTFFRVFTREKPEQLSLSLYERLAETWKWNGAADEKSSEIKVIPKLLELLDIRGGAVVTINAAGRRRMLATKVREQEADYLLAVKDNQPILHEDIREYFEGLERGETWDIPENIRV